jgi:hypothetical protein
VTRRREKVIAYRYFEGWAASKMRLLVTPRRRWEGIIKIGLEKAGMGCGYPHLV